MYSLIRAIAVAAVNIVTIEIEAKVVLLGPAN